MGGNDKITWLDLTPVFAKGTDGLKAELFLSDQLHLTQAGYQAWHEALYPVLKQALGIN